MSLETPETATETATRTEAATGVILTENAALKVKGLLDQEGRDDLALRIAVQPGGCSGLRYQLFFDERQLDGDVVADFGGVSVVSRTGMAGDPRRNGAAASPHLNP